MKSTTKNVIYIQLKRADEKHSQETLSNAKRDRRLYYSSSLSSTGSLTFFAREEEGLLFLAGGLEPDAFVAGRCYARDISVLKLKHHIG